MKFQIFLKEYVAIKWLESWWNVSSCLFYCKRSLKEKRRRSAASIIEQSESSLYYEIFRLQRRSA